MTLSANYHGDLPFGLPARLPHARLTVDGEMPDLSLSDLTHGDALLRELRVMTLPGGTARLETAGHWAEARHDADAGRLHLTVPLLGLDRSYLAETGADAERIVRRLWRRNRGTLETAYLKWSAAHRADDPVAGNSRSTLTLMTTSSVQLGLTATQPATLTPGGRPVAVLRGQRRLGEHAPNGVPFLQDPQQPGWRTETGWRDGAGRRIVDDGRSGLSWRGRDDRRADVTDLRAGWVRPHDGAQVGPTPRGRVSSFASQTAFAAPVGERTHLVFTAPVYWASAGGAHRLNGAANLGLMTEALPNWTLGAMAQGGVGAQSGLGGAWIAGGTLASRYGARSGDTTFSLVNSLSHFRTLPFDSDAFGAGQGTVSYELSNLALRNGVAAETPWRSPDGIRPDHLFGLELSETRFSGDDLYVDQAWEAAVTWRRVDPRLGQTASARLSALMTNGGEAAARMTLDLAF